MSDPTVPDRDPGKLAPLFAATIKAALEECRQTAAPGGEGFLDAKVFEALRSNERQAWLYAQGRTRPGDKVTNAKTATTSWHGYGLAVDVVHTTKLWNPYGSNEAMNEKWFRAVAAVFKKHGCNWGGDWQHPDTPHMQWGKCTASPTSGVIALYNAADLKPVWAKVLAA